MAKIKGKKAAQINIRSIPEKAVRQVGAALFAAGDIIKTDAQVSITTGAVSGKSHKPSAPGQPPNEDTGTLRRSIIVTQPAPLRVRISANAPYAAIHEFGGTIQHPGGTAYFVKEGGLAVFVNNETAARYASRYGRELPRTKPHSITIPARPYLGPAARKNKKVVRELVADAVKQAIRSN